MNTMNNGRLFFDSSLHGNMLVLGNEDPFFHGSRSFLNTGETSKRLPFFYSSNDLLEEEFYDEQSPEKKRRLTSEQIHTLEKSFDEENKLEPERKTELAKKLGLQPRQVAVWFQNRRARSKTKQLEREYDLLKASYDSLLSNYGTIVQENEKLKSQVVSLEEKLQAKEEAGMTTMVVSQKSDPPLLADDYAEFAVIQVSVKAEDRLSTVSGRSVIVDEDGLQLVDSGNSYFSSEEYVPCMVGPIEEYGQQQHQEEETELMGWWVWS